MPFTHEAYSETNKDIPTSRAPAPVERVSLYTPLKPNIRITNRAEKGYLKNRPVLLFFDGKPIGDDMDPENEGSWLQPGESIVVSKDVILGLFGNIMFHKNPTALPIDAKEDIIKRFGGWVYNGIPEAGLPPNVPVRLHIIDYPKNLPDLILQQLDQKARDVDEAVAIYDVLTAGKKINKKLPNTLND